MESYECQIDGQTYQVECVRNLQAPPTSIL